MESEKNEMERREALRLSNNESNKLTKDCLFEALIRLMKKMSFEKITVTELVKCAGVSRTAFYRNYSNIADIIRERLNIAIEDVYKSLQEKNLTDMYLWYHDVLVSLAQSAEMIRIILRSAKNYLSSPTLVKMFQKVKKNPTYKEIAFMGAMDSLLLEWIENPNMDKVDEVTEICVSLHNNCDMQL